MPSSAPYTIRNAYGTKTTSGPTTAIAAPGVGKRLVVHYCRMTRNVATDVTIITKDGSTQMDSITLTSEIPGILEVLPDDLAFRLGDNAAYVFDFSADVSVSWRLRYRIENA